MLSNRIFLLRVDHDLLEQKSQIPKKPYQSQQTVLLRTKAVSSDVSSPPKVAAISHSTAVQTEAEAKDGNHILKTDSCSSPILTFLTRTKYTRCPIDNANHYSVTDVCVQKRSTHPSHPQLYCIRVFLVKASNLPKSNLAISSSLVQIQLGSAQEYLSQVIHSFDDPISFNSTSHLFKVHDRSQFLSINVLTWYPNEVTNHLGHVRIAVAEIVAQLDHSSECTYSLVDNSSKLVRGKFGTASITVRFMLVKNSEVDNMAQVPATSDANGADAKQTYPELVRLAAARRLQGYMRMAARTQVQNLKENALGGGIECNNCCEQSVKSIFTAAVGSKYRKGLIMVGCHQSFLDMMTRRVGVESTATLHSVEQLADYFTTGTSAGPRMCAWCQNIVPEIKTNEDREAFVASGEGESQIPRLYAVIDPAEGVQGTDTASCTGVTINPPSALENDQPCTTTGSFIGEGVGWEELGAKAIFEDSIDAIMIPSIEESGGGWTFPRATIGSRPSSPLVSLDKAHAGPRTTAGAHVLVEPPWTPSSWSHGTASLGRAGEPVPHTAARAALPAEHRTADDGRRPAERGRSAMAKVLLRAHREVRLMDRLVALS
jgi:hypothetical protein